MTFERRSSPTCAHALTRELGVVVIAIVLMFACGALSVAAYASGDTVPHLTAKASSAPCTSLTISESATTNEKSYGPRSVVTMTASIHNTSTQTCSVAVGPTSPSLIVDNSGGVEVWSNCGGAGEFDACALYLLLETLQPGGTYTKTATWDQGSGASGARVPPGVFQLNVHFDGVSGQVSTKFNLTALAPPRTINVTQADSGRTYSLTRGTRLVVELSGPTIYTWTAPVSSNPSVVKRLASSSSNATLTTFVAQMKGESRITAVGNPTCYPQCLMASRLFTITATVVS